MCIVSALIDHGQSLPASIPSVWPPIGGFTIPVDHSKEIAELKKQFKDLDAYVKLLEAAHAFDKQTEQPHCEDKSKVETLENILLSFQNIFDNLKNILNVDTVSEMDDFSATLIDLEMFIDEYKVNA
jgi:molecular chaperone GrpE (heat shock protein)